MEAGQGESGRSVTALEAFVGRHAWKVFTALSTLIVLFGLGDVLVGGATFVNGESVLFRTVSGTTWPELQSAHPGAANLIDYMVRAGGLHLLVVGLLSLAICLTALRRRERWAWYAMTAWIAWLAVIPAMLQVARRDQEGGIPVPVISGSILLAVALVTLALSFRSYARPRKCRSAPGSTPTFAADPVIPAPPAACHPGRRSAAELVMVQRVGEQKLTSFVDADDRYFAYSTARVSRMTVTLIWPG